MKYILIPLLSLTVGCSILEQVSTSPPLERGILLFHSEDGISWIDPDTSKAEEVLHFDSGGRRGLSWAPDGMHFAYASNHDGNWRMYVANLKGETSRAGEFVENYILQIEWAPAGEWIAYEHMGSRVGTGGVALVNAMTGERKSLTAPEGHDGEFAWMPDGKRIAVAATLSSEVIQSHDVIYVDRRSGIELVDAASGERQRIATLDTQAFALSAAPDGQSLLYIADGTLWSVQAKVDSEPMGLLDSVGNHVTPRYSPDGKSISGVRRQKRAGSAYDSEDVPFVLGPDGERHDFEPRPLTSEILWRADGKALALTDSNGLVLLDPTGSQHPLAIEDCAYQSGLDWNQPE